MIGVGVMGASGYAGAELLRLIAGHPRMRLAAAGANERAGQPITAAHPQLGGHGGMSFVANDSGDLLGSDLVFMAMPHGRSGQVEQMIADVPRVVDLGADHRLRNAEEWRTYYGDAERSSPWVYGLPEMPGRRAEIARSTRVANPGCYATAVQIALAPVIGAGLVEPRRLAVVAASGTTGAGRTPTEKLHASAVIGSMVAYRAGGVHQHTPEIEQGLADATGRHVEVCFTPMLAPMARGIIATCVGAACRTLGPREVADALIDSYAKDEFVTVLDGDSWPATGPTAGSNQVVLRGTFDRRTGAVTVVAALDNLGKGAAGQAIQNANLMLGFPEGMGLTSNGVSP